MRGIRITSEFQETSPGCAVPIGFPDDTSAFALFFAPILPRIQTIHWLYHSWPFVRGDEEFDREVAKLPPNNGEYNEGFGYIPPDLLLPRFARYVTNDWASFYGFHQKPDAKKFFEAMPDGQDGAFLSRTVDLCFFNVDAVWWDFYSRDESLIAAVRKHAATLKHIVIEDRNLLKYDDQAA
jgi:hypothetical protein